MPLMHVIAERCHWCSREYPRHRMMQVQSSGQAICDNCLAWHFRALDFLGGAVPAGCQVCAETWDALQERNPVQVRMYVVPKDGIMQILCASCAQPYVKKRGDLYRGTDFEKRGYQL